MAWPYRTGLPTVEKLLRIVKRILTKYSELYPDILTTEQVSKIIDLLDCITAFLDDVPSHDPTE